MPTMTKTPKFGDDLISDEAAKALIFDWMEANGVAVITVELHGEHDSGNFEQYVELTIADKTIDWKARELLYTKLRRVPVQLMDKTVNLEEFIVEVSRKIENAVDHGVDWWSNDGGQGCVQWILDGPGEDGRHYRRGVCLTVEARVISYKGKSYDVFGCVTPDEEEPSDKDRAAIDALDALDALNAPGEGSATE